MSINSPKKLFNPGEPVFLQGEKITKFFGILEGRFAKIHSNSENGKSDLKKLLSNAKLLEVVSNREVFGEIEALLSRPQPYSVFALDPGEVFHIPTEDSTMQSIFGKNPQYGVSTCIAFSKRLVNVLSEFTSLIAEEEKIDHLVQSSARAYISLINELTQVCSMATDPLITFAMNMNAYEESKVIEGSAPPAAPSSSVYCAVVRTPTSDSKIQYFAPGTLICKRETIGDRLYVVKEGVVEVLLGKGHSIQIARPGSIIGEIAVFQNLAAKTPHVKRTADVVCVTKVAALVLGLEDIEGFFAQNPELMTNLLLAMVERTRETHMLVDLTRERLHTKLFTTLRTLLEGFHKLSHKIAERTDNLSLSRPLDFAANHARIIYNRFSEVLKSLGQ